MTVGDLIGILNELPPDLEVILKSSDGLKPLEIKFSDKVQMVMLELDEGDHQTFVMISEDEDEDQFDILKFLN